MNKEMNLSRGQVFEWFKRFKEGCKKNKDDARPVRPCMSKPDANTKKIGQLMLLNSNMSISITILSF